MQNNEIQYLPEPPRQSSWRKGWDNFWRYTTPTGRILALLIALIGGALILVETFIIVHYSDFYSVFWVIIITLLLFMLVSQFDAGITFLKVKQAAGEPMKWYKEGHLMYAFGLLSMTIGACVYFQMAMHTLPFSFTFLPVLLYLISLFFNFWGSTHIKEQDKNSLL